MVMRDGDIATEVVRESVKRLIYQVKKNLDMNYSCEIVGYCCSISCPNMEYASDVARTFAAIAIAKARITASVELN